MLSSMLSTNQIIDHFHSLLLLEAYATSINHTWYLSRDDVNLPTKANLTAMTVERCTFIPKLSKLNDRRRRRKSQGLLICFNKYKCASILRNSRFPAAIIHGWVGLPNQPLVKAARQKIWPTLTFAKEQYHWPVITNSWQILRWCVQPIA